MLLIRIEHKRAFWLAREPAAYSYEFSRQCVCPPRHFKITQHTLGPIASDDEFGFIVRLDYETGNADSSGSITVANFRILQ